MSHPWHDIIAGEHTPKEFNTIVEIPLGSSVKYELDSQTGLIRMDRPLYLGMYYPANYGFIPQTLVEDGGPLDVLVLAQEAVAPLTIVPARAIGLITMLDTGKKDHKISRRGYDRSRIQLLSRSEPTPAPSSPSASSIPPRLQAGRTKARRSAGNRSRRDGLSGD